MSYDELWVGDERYKLRENKSKEEYRGALDLKVKVSFYDQKWVFFWYFRSLGCCFPTYHSLTLMAETPGFVL